MEPRNDAMITARVPRELKAAAAAKAAAKGLSFSQAVKMLLQAWVADEGDKQPDK